MDSVAFSCLSYISYMETYLLVKISILSLPILNALGCLSELNKLPKLKYGAAQQRLSVRDIYISKK